MGPTPPVGKEELGTHRPQVQNAPHEWCTGWAPGRKRGDENDIYQAYCLGCGYYIEDPQDDVYYGDHGESDVDAEALTPKWLERYGHPTVCPKPRPPPPTLWERILKSVL